MPKTNKAPAGEDTVGDGIPPPSTWNAFLGDKKALFFLHNHCVRIKRPALASVFLQKAASGEGAPIGAVHGFALACQKKGDLAGAVYNYDRAAKMGSALSIHNFAAMIINGLLGPPEEADTVHAIILFMGSAMRGVQASKQVLRDLRDADAIPYAKLSARGVPRVWVDKMMS